MSLHPIVDDAGEQFITCLLPRGAEPQDEKPDLKEDGDDDGAREI